MVVKQPTISRSWFISIHIFWSLKITRICLEILRLKLTKTVLESSKSPKSCLECKPGSSEGCHFPTKTAPETWKMQVLQDPMSVTYCTLRWCSFHFPGDLSGCGLPFVSIRVCENHWGKLGSSRKTQGMLCCHLVSWMWWCGGVGIGKKMGQRSVIENYETRRFKQERRIYCSSDGFTKTRLIMRIWRSKSLMLKHQVSTLTTNNLLSPKMGKPVENSFFLDLCRCFFSIFPM